MLGERGLPECPATLQTEAELWLAERRFDPDPFKFNSKFYSKDWTRFSDPVAMEKRASEFSRQFELREQFIAHFGYAILTRYTINELLQYSPLVEVGAGSGYWSHELRKAGADIIATEPDWERNGHAIQWDTRWTDLEEIDAVTAVRKYPERNVLMVWPTYTARWAAEALKAMTIGRVLLYVGEGAGGCTANDTFHRRLEVRCEYVATISIPQFYGIHDSLQVYRKIK